MGRSEAEGYEAEKERLVRIVPFRYVDTGTDERCEKSRDRYKENLLMEIGGNMGKPSWKVARIDKGGNVFQYEDDETICGSKADLEDWISGFTKERTRKQYTIVPYEQKLEQKQEPKGKEAV